MSYRSYRIRLATINDLPRLMTMRQAAIDAIPDITYSRTQLDTWRDATVSQKYKKFIHDNCLWVIDLAGIPVASAGIRLSTCELIAVFTAPAHAGQGQAKRLTAYVEQQACRFGILKLACEASLNAVDFYYRQGYRKTGSAETCDRLNLPCIRLQKSLKRRQTRYQQKVFTTLTSLGIECDYGIQRALPVHQPTGNIRKVGHDYFGRSLHLTPSTYQAWKRMQLAATADDVDLQIVSGFRNLRYQTRIIQKKLDSGQRIKDILAVSAAPGFSEHHTGRAIDLHTRDCPLLEEEFAGTAAYVWLKTYAQQFHFQESYPENNHHGITWEPWHWCFNR